MKKFNIDDYEENTVMSFANKEEYDAFCKYLDKLGKKWSSGTKYTTEIHNSAFIPYDERGLYFLKGTYSDLDRIKDDDKLLKYSDFDWSEEGLSTLTKEEYMREMTEKEKKAELCGKQSLLPTPEEWGEEHQLYVATDRSGNVWAYIEKPKKNDFNWVKNYDIAVYITNLVKPQTGENWEDSLYIPTSLRPKYEPYKEPKLDWIDKEVYDHENETKGIIKEIGKRNGAWYVKVKLFCGTRTVGLDRSLEDFTWSDGTPFGELIE